MRSVEDTRVFVHRLDASDRIIWVNDEWIDFAHENDAPELSRNAVLSHKIWDFICDPDTTYLYELILAKVRFDQRSLTVSYRCDSPALRRFMELTVAGVEHDIIEFRCRILREEAREYVSLVDRAVQRSGELVRVCAWCKRLCLSGDTWVEIEHGLRLLQPFSGDYLPEVTHGMCRGCYEEKLAQIHSTAGEVR